MKKLTVSKKFTIRKKEEIKASKEAIWNVLLTPELFTRWGAAFCPDSRMEGTWKKGGSISYTDNKGMGLKGKVIEFEPNNRVTVEYSTVLMDFKKTIDKEGWTGCTETYELLEKNGVTNLSIETQVPSKKYQVEFSKSWDQALSEIKNLAEKNETSHTTKIFVNLPVSDLDKSKNFFSKLGFSINPQFTDNNAACMIINESIYLMLLVQKFFKTFTKKNLCNATQQTEAILALSAGSRKEVDEMAKKAVAAGGKIHRKPEDHGWMYGQSFEDPDGHLWEIFWMDPSKIK